MNSAAPTMGRSDAGRRPVVETALQLAEEYGLPVFPCKPDKTPYTKHGFKDASTNIEQIAAWWEQWPDALIGVPTGKASRLLVIDVDPAGANWYADNAAELACARTHRTRRGHHLLYRMQAAEIGNSAGKIATGIDVRGEGGYIVWWPAHGCEASGDLEDVCEPPDWLLQRLTAGRANGHAGHDVPPRGKQGPGARNDTLTRMAGSMRKANFSDEAISAALHAENYAQFDPPLPGAEVNGICDQAAKWPRGKNAPVGSEWVPPALVTYGEGFDPAQIPQRDWLLGRRRSIGELTVDVGPPGVNKSTLLLSDAISIVTGKRILQDQVWRTGSVLYLAGEDARRDVEARIAGVLARYRIEPKDLAGRLHVIYLAEVDVTEYTLAEMVKDVAVLNDRMLEWLRELPEIVAVLIDPLAAWHRLIESSNEAQQLLCSTLRALAVQGRRHVGLDHHITKVSQNDSEAHVGNLVAIRGASAIGASVRWAFTLARLKTETALAFGIIEDDRKRFRRLDPLKASYGADDGDVRLLRVESVRIANGEEVGVLVEVDTDSARAAAVEREQEEANQAQQRLTAALTRMLAEARPRTAAAAALWLQTRASEVLPRSKAGEVLALDTVRKKLPALIGAGLATSFEGQATLIVIEVEPGKGKANQIDFALPAMEGVGK